MSGPWHTSVQSFQYHAPSPLTTMSMTTSASKVTVAIGSYKAKEPQYVRVLEASTSSDQLKVVAEHEVRLPPTKLMWDPSAGVADPADLQDIGPALCASSDGIDIFKYKDGALHHKKRLHAHKVHPMTSFDWNMYLDRIVGSSVDTTCVIWDTNQGKIESQLIAHDKPVFDVTWGPRESICRLFATVGEDGSMRIFDARNLEHSTIIYETERARPLTRLAWNPIDKNFIAAVGVDMPYVTIVDVRKPSVIYKALSTNGAAANCVTWSPISKSHLMCGTEDGTTLIWDTRDCSVHADAVKPSSEKSPMEGASPLKDGARKTAGSAYAFTAPAREGAIDNVNNVGVQHVHWPLRSNYQDWVGILRNDTVELLKV